MSDINESIKADEAISAKQLIEEMESDNVSREIVRIIIEDVGNITREVWLPGKINVRTGENGVGKSTGIDAIRTVLSGRNSREMVRLGCKRGLIHIYLADKSEAEMHIFPDKSPYFKYKRDGKYVQTPREIINTLVSSMNVNMSRWLDGGVQERTDLIIESVPFELDHIELVEIIERSGAKNIELPGNDASPVAAIEKVAKALLKDRLNLDYDLKKTRGLKEKTQEKITEDYDPEWKPDLSRIDEQITEAANEQSDLLEGINQDFASQKEILQDEWQLVADNANKTRTESLETLHSELNNQRDNITELENQLRSARAFCVSHETAVEEKIEAVYDAAADKTELNAKTGVIEGQQAVAVAEFKANYANNNADLRVEKEQITSRIERQESNRTHTETVQEAAEEIEALVNKIRLRDRAGNEIRDLKQRMFEGCPIPELEIVDNEIYLAGIRVDRVNQAQIIMLLLEIANLKSKPHGIRTIMIEDFGRLDSKGQALFKETAENYKLQVFATMVNDEPLKNNIEGGEKLAAEEPEQTNLLGGETC